MSIRAVGFDLDETLAVPARDRSTLLQEATAAVDAPSMTREAYLDAHADHLTGETRAPIFADLLGDGADTDPDDLARVYRERVTDSLEPLPATERLLSTLRERYRLGLLTNGPVVAQRDKLAALGLDEAFDVALVTGDLEAGKPDARAFEALLDGLGTDAAETAYVGDDPEADVAGAARAGLRTVQVIYDGGPDPNPTADAHVARTELCDALPDVLQSL